MMNISKQFAVTGAAALVVATVAFALRSEATETLSVRELPRHTHIHGIAVDRQDPSHLFIATHHGVFRAGPDVKAQRISEVKDFMGFSPHPTDANTLYASGHPPEGGNLGFIASTDAGKTWKQISPGVNGPVDFHQMTVSPADPNTIYGSYKGLQVSRDGGKTWTVVGPTPEKLIDLSASARDPNTLYAATERGLLVSADGGKNWKPVLEGMPVTLVKVTPSGTLYAFVVGGGLMSSAEPVERLTPVNVSFGQSYLTFLASDPTNPKSLFAVTHKGEVLASSDQGKTWSAFSGSGS